MGRMLQFMSAAWWRPFTPKLVTVLREGYGAADLRQDFIAGLTVAIVALPLAMALAIASGTTPDKGLVTAIVAGFLISALGGSRVQIGGPTGAFVVVVFNVIATHGYDGLVLATLMAGVMLVIAGFARFGTWIKYIPEPVVTGFTAGIAVIIFTSQIKDLLGLPVAEVPADFLDKIRVFAAHMDAISPASVAISGLALAVIILLRRHAPRAPAFLIVVVAASLAVALFGVETDTIGSRFGGIPSSLPAPSLPEITFARMAELLPSAFTIAFLAGVESLLSAVVADGMTGFRHRSNTELIAQGVANSASALFGGLPATGAIARTATNIRSGARSPMAGMFHALFLLLAILLLAPLAVYVPLAALAAVLVMVAWNMSDAPRFRHLLSAPPGDVAVLLITFALTVLVDLTVAIEVGVVMAALLFMHRMAEVVAVGSGPKLIASGDERDAELLEEDQRQGLPAGIEVFQIQGPLFFGVANRLNDFLEALRRPPKIMILRLRHVPLMDASGVTAFENFIERCRRAGIRLIISGLQPQPRMILRQMGVKAGWPEHEVTSVRDYAAARELAERELKARAAE
ncbi:MAG TPA: sulfate permease [Sphingomonadales bacterium]